MKTLLFALFTLPALVFAQAQVFPTRLTLTEDAPSSYLTLRNPTNKAQKFKIELLHLQMQKDGNVVAARNDNNVLIDGIKYSPKTVEIAPNDKQVVRVMMTSFDSLPEGESHIYLHFIPEGSNEPKSNSKFNLQARIAVAVPVIVRHGSPKLEAQLKNAAAVEDKNGNVKISFEVANTTKYFVTGNLEIRALTPQGEVSLTKILSISSYIPLRVVTVELKKEDLTAKLAEAPLAKLKILYNSNEDSAAPFELSAEVQARKAGGKASKRR